VIVNVALLAVKSAKAPRDQRSKKWREKERDEMGGGGRHVSGEILTEWVGAWLIGS
jgi:hypothetical protein